MAPQLYMQNSCVAAEEEESPGHFGPLNLQLTPFFSPPASVVVSRQDVHGSICIFVYRLVELKKTLNFRPMYAVLTPSL